MKKIILMAFMVLLVSGAFAQFGTTKSYSKTESDAKYATKTENGAKADTANVITPADLAAQSANLYDYVYSKDAADSVDENRVFNWVKTNMFSKALALPMTSYTIFGTPQAMIDGRLYITYYKMNKDTVITSLNTFMSVQGSYTEDNYNGMLIYTVNATGVTEVGRTTNDGAIWKTAMGTKLSKTFGSSISVTKNQIIGIGCIYNSSAQTTAPSLPGTGYVGNSVTYFTKIKLASVVTNVNNPASSYTWGQLGGNQVLVGIWPE